MVRSEAQARALIAQLQAATDVVDTGFEEARIRWRRIGSGRPLVLLHGGNGSWLHWVRNIEALAAAHELWLPDLPGCGESDALAPPASLERLVRALGAGLDVLLGAGREIDLAAFSFGSVLASNLAVARGRVRRLALLGATGHGFARTPLSLRNWRTLPPEAQDEAHRHNLATLMLHEPAAIDALALVMHRSASERTRLRSKQLSHTGATRQALDRLALPMLLVWGEHDPTAGGAEVARALAAGHPERQWLVVPGAGHWVQYERAAEINPLLARWFA
ncbi:alpha/beta fold hydrolase [Ramlibacter sp.]|uniref:alpha/beta fold hydrolase n=1 Tax=Ramlibacter sp. TaxID=1917967 RepID=UPI002CD06A50|nr:alpha/beta fold hydrolase [Ramlibacter sp.]HWI82124.1 alpha/beta fold hydrolase [Ramlibacter sp.]